MHIGLKKMALAGLLFAGLVGKASANSVLNGSFEGPGNGPTTFTTSPGGIGPTNWIISSGTIDYIGNYWNAADGQYSVDMSGNGAGTIGQTLTGLTPGHKYALEFAMSGNPDGGPSLKELLVSVSNSNLLAGQTFSYDTSVKGNTRSDMKWQTMMLNFTPTSESAYLQFLSLARTPYGPALDKVSVGSAVPVPAAAWLGFALLGGVLAQRLRRAF